MLALTHGKDQGVEITTPDGYTIKVVVVSVSRGKAKVGYIADRCVKIVRTELGAFDPLLDPTAKESDNESTD